MWGMWDIAPSKKNQNKTKNENKNKIIKTFAVES